MCNGMPLSNKKNELVIHKIIWMNPKRSIPSDSPQKRADYDSIYIKV